MSTKLDQTQHDSAVLPRIRDLEAGRLSLRQIADQLQADGFPSPGGQRQWSYVAVKRILDRAGTASPDTPDTPTHPSQKVPPLVITVTGPVTTHGPMAVGGGEVTIKVCAPPSPPNAPHPDPEPGTDTAGNDPPTSSPIIELAHLGGLFTLPPGSGLHGYPQSFPSPGFGFPPPAPSASIALHAALYLRRGSR